MTTCVPVSFANLAAGKPADCLQVNHPGCIMVASLIQIPDQDTNYTRRDIGNCQTEPIDKSTDEALQPVFGWINNHSKELIPTAGSISKFWVYSDHLTCCH